MPPSGDAADAASKTAKAEEKARAVGVERSVGKEWMDAAKAGNLGDMMRLLHTNPRLLTYQGQGTSYGFVGHTALHWCAAKGHLAALQWLLEQGAPASAPNLAGSTPLHSAASNGQAESINLLIHVGGADLNMEDEFGETPRDAAEKRQCAVAVSALDLCRVAARLRESDPAQWSLRDVRAVLQHAGVDTLGIVEKEDLLGKCKEYIAGIERLRVRVAPPSTTAPTPTPAAAAPPPATAAAPANPPPATAEPMPPASAAPAAAAAPAGRKKLTPEQEKRRALLFAMDKEALAREGADAAAAAEEKAAKNAESERAAVAAGVAGRAEGRVWLDAAKVGNLGELKAIHEGHGDPSALLAYQGQGTNYNFTANSALHWAAGRGHVDVVRWLLAAGARADLRNAGDATPLHNAAQEGRAEAAKFLLLEGRADGGVYDGFNQSPVDIAHARGHTEIIRQVRLCGHVAALRSGEEGTWSVKAMREALALAGVDTRDCVEKPDFVAKARQLLTALPEPVSPADPGPLPTPAPAPARAAAPAAARAPPPPQPAGDDGSDDEGAEPPPNVALAEAAKAKGNAFFNAGEYRKAAENYKIAIRFDETNHILYSNRSGAYAALHEWELALEDAELCVRLQPNFAKGFSRLGAAYLGVRQAGEAVKAYERGLDIEPGNQGLLDGRADAQKMIVDFQRQYEERWGAGGEGGEGSTPVDAHPGGIPKEKRKPWFECPLCENRTRDSVLGECCGKTACGTCTKRAGGCAFGCAAE